MTKIMKCTCTHSVQDKMYGTGNRVHNTCGKDEKTARCTVCKTVKGG